MAELDIKKAEELEKKYDSGLQTRVIGPYLVKFTYYFSILFARIIMSRRVLACRLITGTWARTWPASWFWFLLDFLPFAANKQVNCAPIVGGVYGNVPIWDWLLIIAGVASAYYVGITWYEIDFEFLGGRFQLPDQVMRQGNPCNN